MAGADGNWGCQQCGNVNFAIRNACNRCQAPNPTGAGFQQQSFQQHQQWMPGGKGASGKGAPIAGADGNWACPSCQNVNFAMRNACNRCQTPKPQERMQMFQGGRGPSGAPIAGADGNWSCPECQNINFPARGACNRCQAPKPQDSAPVAGHGGGGGKWACHSCQSMNFPNRMTCFRCAAERPHAGEDAELQELEQFFAQETGQGQQAPTRGAPVAGMDGNWACANCSNVNFAVRNACNRCQMPKPHEVQFQQPQQSSRGPGGAPTAGVDGNWGCPVCQNINFGMRTSCNRCQTPKPQDEMLAPQHMEPSHQGGRTQGGAPIAGLDGNWACPMCSNINFPMRTSCNRCQTPKPQDESTLDELANFFEAQVEHAAPQKGGKGPPMAGLDGNWACTNCSNVNFAIRNACNRCQMPKPQEYFQQHTGRALGGAPMAGVDGNWACVQCKNVNFAVRESCNRCQGPKSQSVFEGWGGGAAAAGAKGGGGKGKAPVAGVDGNWACPGCGNINFPMREACNRCQGPKPEEEMIWGGDDGELLNQLLQGDDSGPPGKRMKYE
mmetsp:Transcript_14405/g.39569  ORF Transcript_14405/g.39569 Transcript_14405/m.39569 type:complete len:554 (-) Transcript_14405:91-1752(-)